MRDVIRSTALAMLAATLLTVGGCAASADRHVYESTADLPTNVTVIDSEEDQRLWHMEVPVGHELEVNFNRAGLEREGMRVSDVPPNRMTWTLYETALPYEDPDVRVGDAVADGEVRLPGHEVRMLVNYREQQAVSGEGLYRIEQYTRPAEMQEPDMTPEVELEGDETEGEEMDDETADGEAADGEASNGAATRPATQPAEE